MFCLSKDDKYLGHRHITPFLSLVQFCVCALFLCWNRVLIHDVICGHSARCFCDEWNVLHLVRVTLFLFGFLNARLVLILGIKFDSKLFF